MKDIEVLGYKGVQYKSSKMTDSERDEYDNLREIFLNIQPDIFGKVLTRRYAKLSENLSDSAIFCCPYIPLQIIRV